MEVLLGDPASGDWPLGSRMGRLATGLSLTRDFAVKAAEKRAVVQQVWGQESLFSDRGEIGVFIPNDPVERET